MIQVTICSGHEGRLRPDKRFYLTLFGGCTLSRPTVARQLAAAREAGRTQPGQSGQQFFLTVCGGVDIKCPTMAEEFVDLAEMIRSGTLHASDWDRAIASLGKVDHSPASFTLFGAFSEFTLPTEKEEVESLALHRHMGNISESSGKVLQLAIGQGESDRLATLRRAVSTLG